MATGDALPTVSIMMVETEREEQLRIPVKINGIITCAVIDSGAVVNLIGEDWATRNNITVTPKRETYKVKVADRTLAVQDGGEIKNEAQGVLMTIQGHHEKITLDVMRVPGHSIVLGKPWLRRHNPPIDWRTGQVDMRNCICKKEERQKPVWVIQKWFAIEKHEEIPAVYREYTELFMEKPWTNALPKHQPWDHEIPLEEGTSPTHGPIYQMTEQEQKAVRDYLKTQLEKGWIRPSTSPAGYPVLFANKKDGSLRFCVDYRQLNRITIKNRHTLPLISELQDKIRGANWLTKLDLRDAYQTVRIKSGEEWKTGFKTSYGHYEYTVMPFGLTNAPATFQALINDILREYLDDFVIAYLDDIMIYTKGILEEHQDHVRKVLHKLQEKDMRLKREKCEFHKQEVEFLGMIISGKEVKMDPEKLKAIQEWPEPTNLKETQSFLGFTNYYRKFIKDYSRIAEPMTRILKKDKKEEWGEDQSKAYKELKEQFVPGKVLRHYQPGRETRVGTDASGYAIGAHLEQKDDEGRFRPTVFYSRKLTLAERNYPIHDQELLGIVEAL